MDLVTSPRDGRPRRADRRGDDEAETRPIPRVPGAASGQPPRRVPGGGGRRRKPDDVPEQPRQQPRPQQRHRYLDSLDSTGSADAAETTEIAKVTDPAEPAESAEPPESADAAPPAATSGHGHSHEPPPPASTRVRTLLAVLLAPFLLTVFVVFIALFPTGGLPDSAVDSGTPVNGTVTAASLGSCMHQPSLQQPGGQPGQPAPGEPQCLLLDITLTDGPAVGSIVTKTAPVGPSRPTFAVGDDVVLAFSGSDPSDDDAYLIMDFQRGTPLLMLAAVFVGAVLLLGRWHGARALAGLGVSALVLGFFVVPAILTGEDPLLTGIVGAGLIMFATLYFTHGFSVRTSVALLGTLISLLLIGIISAVFSGLAQLTGLDDQTSNLVAALGHGIDTQGLLLAGVVIGALGVLDDVTVTQASAIWELRRANPLLTWRDLYDAGVRIGRDHVASAVNTLVLAYAGAALPVLLYTAVSGVGFGTILTSQDIAQEILRTLAGSVGIVAAVPLTSVLAAVIVSRETVPALSREPKPEADVEAH
ncbi:MAG: YibE/F family protein [Actinophytocola sp.]|nr:YibE/F family protein [Actinophytocola sp.]